MNTTTTVLAKIGFNNGTQQDYVFDTVEQAILAYRRKKAKYLPVMNRASSFTYSIDNGATWLK